MYESFFGMEHTPFVRDIPAEKLYESDAFRETLGRLCYVADRQMFAVVTADPGCGKSTLIRRFYSELPREEYIILYLSDSKLTPRWFYKGMLDQLGLEARFYRGDSKRQLQQQIEIIHGVQHKKVVCVLDEAHLLEKETLEEFRFLLNYRFDSVSPMAVVLVGQTELWDNKLKLQRYAAIRQRIDMYCTLPHLDGQRQNSMSKAIWIMRNAARRSLQPKQWTRSIKLRPGFREWSTGCGRNRLCMRSNSKSGSSMIT